MSAATVRRLRDVRLTDAAEVGGKAASLGELIAAGVRVPEGVVMTEDEVARTSGRRRWDIAASEWEIGTGPFAVRSSGISEDGTEQSFAGMYDTILGVSAGALADAADRVLASGRSARPAGYARAGESRMAVIIQPMVDATASGVALTADPITGDRHTCIVTAVRGLGERLVSGAAAGDEWAVVDGTATARRQAESAIAASQAVDVAGEARRIAEMRGMPQDVEWAIDADGTLWILQARPMTALPPEVSWIPPAPGASPASSASVSGSGRR